MSFFAVFASVLLCVLSIVPLSMIAIGYFNLNNCPHQYLVPIWLIVFGTFCIVDTILRCFCSRTLRRGEPGEAKYNPFSAPIHFFLVVWFVLGEWRGKAFTKKYRNAQAILVDPWGRIVRLR